MTVISAAIVTRQGRVLLSKQYTDITRIRVEGLLSAFPRLLDSSSNHQATFIEADTIRYVYQPMEDLFLLLITTKNSNIVEDIATVHLMGRLLSEFVITAVTEAAIAARAFEIMFAFDEVIVSGKRENTTIEQIVTYLEMDSHEERVALEEKRILEKKAKEEARRKAAEIRRRKEDSMLTGGGGGGGAYGGMGSGDSYPRPDYGSPGIGSSSIAMTNYSGGGGMGGTSAPPAAGTTGLKPAGLRTGMALGGMKKGELTKKVLQEAGGAAASAPEASTAAVGAGQPSGLSGAQQEGVHVTVEEKLSAQLNRDGGATNVDIRGDLGVFVSDPSMANVRIALGQLSPAFSFKAHAKVNKSIFADDHVLCMTDGKAFPVQQAVVILRWRLQQPNSIRAPLMFTCWPSEDSITIEYELDDKEAVLHHVRVAIPLEGAPLAQAECSSGDFEVSGGTLYWSIPQISASSDSGSIDINMATSTLPENCFFPIAVNFTSTVSAGHVRVVSINRTDNGEAVRHSSETRLVTENYEVS